MNRVAIIVAVLVVVAGGGAGGMWLLQSSNHVDVAVQTGPGVQSAPAAPTPQTKAATQAVTVEDLIDGYAEMSKFEKMKAVKAFAMTSSDPQIKQILAAEYSQLFNDADEYAGKKYQGVVPEGWQQ